MTQTTNSNKTNYDLEERTFRFAQRSNAFIRELPRTITNIENGKQLARSSGSVGANYIEANESLSKKDFILRIKICKKEAKESRYWLRLIEATSNYFKEQELLQQESMELMKIFGAIMEKTK